MQCPYKRFALALALALCCAAPGAAEDAAGDLDHLLCYKMKDSMGAPARFDLLARLQPEFSRAGCELVLDHDDEVNSQFCVPASKRNVETPNHDPNLAGAPLADDYICYRIECPEGARPPNKIVADQFGERQVRFGQPARICVPATKEPVGCGQIGVNSKGVPTCGGVCPQTGNRCQLDKVTRTCGCGPADCGGKSDGVGVCGGACPAGDQCAVGVDNRCVCEPRGCGVDPSSNQCGGPCVDEGEQCLPATGGGCECTAPAGGCGLDPSSGECGGECPEGLFCLPPTAGGDSCLCRTSGGLG